MPNRHTMFVEASGALARTGANACLYIHLQPEWCEDYEQRPFPIDAPSFIPMGSVIKYNDAPLANMDIIERRLA